MNVIVANGEILSCPNSQTDVVAAAGIVIQCTYAVGRVAGAEIVLKTVKRGRPMAVLLKPVVLLLES